MPTRAKRATHGGRNPRRKSSTACGSKAASCRQFTRAEIDGQNVTVNVAITGHGTRSFTGKVIFVSPLTDIGRHLHGPRPGRKPTRLDGSWLLSPGMRARNNEYRTQALPGSKFAVTASRV